MTTLARALVDAGFVAHRNLLRIRRVPDVLVYSLMTPIMFVLLFAYVFGGSIKIPGMTYREYLIAGIFAQTVVFGSTFTAAGLAEDVQKGVVHRLRSLPIARSAILIGRTASDIIANLLSIIVMAAAGLTIGWRAHTSVAEVVAGFLLLVVFAYAFSWVMAFVGLAVPVPEVVTNASFMVLFPLTFVANTFVMTDRLPRPLRVFAEWNPVSAVTQAARELFGNVPVGIPAADVWSLRHPVAYALMWIVLLLVVFIPLATWQFRRAVTR